ncbi:MAG: type II secretion system F family protein [Candidatus Nanopelagicales bacterium]
MNAWVLLLAGLLASGLVLVVRAAPVWRPVRLSDRVGPYLGLTGRPSTLLSQPNVSAWPTSIRLLQPPTAELVNRLDRLLGGSSSVRHRLDKLAADQTIEKFRLEQLTWCFAGCGVTVLFLAARSTGGHLPAVMPSLLLLITGGLAGLLARDRALTMAVNRRVAQMRTEFPTVVELLALAVSAGEGLTAAVERVSRVGHGAFVHELSRSLNEIRAGTSSVDALNGLADRVELPEVRRFVDAVVVALERGTPLSDVLQAQTSDAREAGRRELIEAGGRKEIAMMVPVVFLILPLSVLFALFPGFYGLSIGS